MSIVWQVNLCSGHDVYIITTFCLAQVQIEKAKFWYNQLMSDLHKEWLSNPNGKVPTGTICPHCARYNARNIACLGLVVRERQVLMIQRKHPPMKTYWALPGGYLDWHETTQECAMRELREETGLDGQTAKLFDVYSDPGMDEDGRQNVGIFYLIEASGKIRPGDDAADVAWFDFDKLPDKIAFNHREVIRDYLSTGKEC